MEFPRPDPAQLALLHRFAGDWSGPELASPSPWGPGGPAIGHGRYRVGLDGTALLQDYEQEKDGATVFRGHGIFLIEPDTSDVLWWWFDSMGFPPEPSRGRWQGETLHFEKNTPRGDARYRYEFGGDRYRFVIENRFPGQSDFAEFIHGDYVRQA
ncbi:MAG: hypothetical protein ACREP7_09600 [Lysobacter sp.]